MSVNNRLVEPIDGYFARVNTAMPQIGVVKENRDPELMGRLKVWIRGSTAPENDPTGWIWVSYCTPFGGATSVSALGRDYQSYDSTQKSYGMWMVPPDVDNEVMVMFVNGDIRKGFWTGCLFHKNMNNMVPGLASGLTYQNNEARFQGNALPTAEYNKLGPGTDGRRPYYEPLALGLLKQGLLSDELRGPSTSGARRESPSKVFGVLTPEGNQLIMDDGENSEMIRLRTKSGAQVLISETFGHVYIVSRDGNTWLELNNDGNVDIYGARNISVRAEEDINLKANRDINIEADGNINMRSQGAKGTSIETRNDLNILTSGQTKITGNQNINVLATGGDIIQKASGNIYQQSVNPAAAAIIPTVQKLDKDVIINSSTEVTVVDTKVDTIVSRLPHHEPFLDHEVVVTGQRETIEENPDVNVSTGSIVPQAKDPLPVTGSPRAGMPEGVYTPKGYKGETPEYSYDGPTTALLTVNNLKTSDEGVSFIARHEGFVPTVYRDAVGKPTIGYGHLIKENTPDYARTGPITEEQGRQLLRQDMAIAESAIRKGVKVKLTQSQFDALVSFAFNVGNGAFLKSTLLRELNKGNYARVPSELMKWNKGTINGKRVPIRGLTNRRKEEGLVFSRPIKTT